MNRPLKFVACVAAMLSSPVATQQVLSTDASLLQVGDALLWLHDGSTGEVVASDGATLHPTGVPATGTIGLPLGSNLPVWSGGTVWLAHADGTRSVLQTPFAPDGLDANAEIPTVWRELVGGGLPPVVEIAEFDGFGWRTRLRQVVPGNPIEACPYTVVQRPGRYVVNFDADSNGDAMVDLLGSSYALLNGTGWACRLDTFSQGVWVTAEQLGGRSDRVLLWFDDGRELELDFPPGWGWQGGGDNRLFEWTPGFPAVDNIDPELGIVSVTAATPRFVSPPDGRIFEFFHCGPLDDLVAVVAPTAVGPFDLALYDASSGQWRSWASGLVTASWIGSLADGALMSLENAGGTKRLVLVSPRRAMPVTDLAFDVVADRTSGTARVGDRLLFAARTAGAGLEFWISDGTPGSTERLVDFTPGAADTQIDRIVSRGDLGAVVQITVGTRQQILTIDELDLVWRLDAGSGRRYRRIEPRTFASAQQIAERLGGHLATLNSGSEQDFVWNTFGGENLWIGLRRSASNPQTFEWVTGEPVQFTNWCPGEPNGLPGEDAVHLADFPGFCSGGWNDQDPNDVYPAIVERTDRPGAVEVLGSGCAAVRGAPPSRAAVQSGAPRIGQSVEVRFDSFAATSVDAWWLSLGLAGLDGIGNGYPFDLAPFGYPGCRVEFDPLLFELLPGTMGRITATYRLQVPNDVAFLERPLLVQGFYGNLLVFDVAFGATNGLRLWFRP